MLQLQSYRGTTNAIKQQLIQGRKGVGAVWKNALPDLGKKIESRLHRIGGGVEKWGGGGRLKTIGQAIGERVEKIPDKRFEEFVKEFVSGFWRQFSDGVTYERWWGSLKKVGGRFGCPEKMCHSFGAGSHQTLPRVLHLCRIIDYRVVTSFVRACTFWVVAIAIHTLYLDKWLETVTSIVWE